MGCAQCREALSARLDGELEPVPAARTDRHLAGCAACRGWQRQAGELTRRLRVRPVAGDPRVVAEVLARAWPPRPAAGRGWRIVLAVLAGAQLALGAAQVAGWHAGMLSATPTRGDMSAHLFDESTAWNIALGVGMAWTAWRSRAAAGMLPVFGGFLLLLAGFCVRDLAAGEVTVERVAEHGLLLVGFTVMLAVRRTAGDSPNPQATAGDAHPPTPFSAAGAYDLVECREQAPGDARLRPVDRRHAA